VSNVDADGRATDPRGTGDAVTDAVDAPSDTAGPTHTDLAAARGSLSRTVTRFAEGAERADDLSRAREYLAAVEDAADALAAVRDAER
jgi:hypothetical protein